MNKYRLFFVWGIFVCFGICLFLFSSCGEKAEQPTFSDEKISQIMADLYLAEAATNGLSGAAKDSLSKVYFKQIMEMHSITTELYEKELMLRAKDEKYLDRIHQEAQRILGETEEGTKKAIQ